MPQLRKVSGEKLLKILCNKFNFEKLRQRGSHVIISKQTPLGKIGTVIPMHSELKIGTLKAILSRRMFLKKKLQNFSKFQTIKKPV